jgi:hypothetical protein
MKADLHLTLIYYMLSSLQDCQGHMGTSFKKRRKPLLGKRGTGRSIMNLERSNS